MSPRLLMFMVTMALANIASFMVVPFESLHVQQLGASVEQVGIFFALAAIAPLISQVAVGWLSDAIGRLQAVANRCGGARWRRGVITRQYAFSPVGYTPLPPLPHSRRMPSNPLAVLILPDGCSLF